MERALEKISEYLEGKVREEDEKERAQSQEGIADDTSVRPNGPGVSSDSVLGHILATGTDPLMGTSPMTQKME